MATAPRLPGPDQLRALGIKTRGTSFQVDVRIGNRRVRRQAPTIAAALALRDELLSGHIPDSGAAKIRPAGPQVPCAERPGSVAQLLARFERHSEVHLRPETTRTIRACAKRLGLTLGDVDAASLTASQLEGYCAARRSDGVGAPAVNRELRVLRRALSLAVEDGALEQAPPVRLLREDRKQPRTLTPEQARTALQKAPAPLAPILTMCALTGWRQGELRALSWSMVNLDAGTAALRANPACDNYEGPKNRAERVVHLSPQAVALLRDQARRVKEKSPDAPVFPAERGGYWNRNVLIRRTRDHLIALGFYSKGLKPLHGFRALFINSALRAGASVQDVADCVGHSNTRTTLGYLTSDADAQRRTGAVVAAAILGQDQKRS